MSMLKAQYHVLPYETRNSQLRKDAAKKKVMSIRKEIKKQESSLTSGINIKIGLKMTLLMVGVWVVYKVGISVVSVIGVYILAQYS